MFKNKKLSYKLILLFILQLVAMSFVFVCFTDKQTFFIIKDFVYSLDLGSNAYTLLGKIYMGIKMMIDLPSAFGVCVFLIHLVCATITLKLILINNCPKKVLVENDKVEYRSDNVESVLFSKNFVYLENLRLLN